MSDPVNSPTVAGCPFGPPLFPEDFGTLAGYRVVRLVARGGSGSVYLGIDPDLQRKVALKVLRPEFAAKPSARDRFLREARATAAVRSDHVVTVFAVSVENGVPYLAMEYLRGQTLEQFQQFGRGLTLPQVLRLGREMALGLAAAHALGVVHRDVKPGNIWLEAPRGRVKLIDFGLARPAVSPRESARPSPGAVLGTPAYMAPEQAAGGAVDARSDLFSLGVVLFRLATSRLPFPGATAGDRSRAAPVEAPIAVRAINPTVPEPLAELIDRLLATDPARRPASAAAVAAEFGRLLGNSALPSAPSTATGVRPVAGAVPATNRMAPQ